MLELMKMSYNCFLCLQFDLFAHMPKGSMSNVIPRVSSMFSVNHQYQSA